MSEIAEMFAVFSWVIAGLLFFVMVPLHYETMLFTSDRIIPWAQRRLHDRRVIMVSMAALMGVHIVEIWIYAFAMMALLQIPGFGGLEGKFDWTLNGFLYFSTVNYTSLGYGDVIPTGNLRAITCSETLTGLLMIAWSASFTYLKMEQIWKNRNG